ncbi:MAG: hypothetical protein LN573_03365 [Rickettsia endosymbiont of Oxypoda opaca]|nr:hypothetical protein [Rickettsia endosymbiont of Oxypoda opaca]
MIKKHIKESNISLDEEEKLLLSSFENDEWKRVKNFDQAKKIAQGAAQIFCRA